MKKNTAPKKMTAAEAIKQLAERYGSVTPEIVLKEASKKTSPLHSHFNWDDSKAAREYRLIQASELIRRIKVEYVVSKNRTVMIRAYHSVSDDSNEDQAPNQRGLYVPVEAALSVKNYRQQLLEQCKRDMQAFTTKYAALSEVAGVLKAMSKFA